MLLSAHSLNDSACFLDCGANYGYWSVLASQVLRRDIVAIELNPVTMEWLTVNAGAATRRIEVLNAAVWDEDGVAMAVSRSGPNQSHSAEVATAAARLFVFLDS